MITLRAARAQDCQFVLSIMNELETADFDKKVFKKLYLENLANLDIIYLIAWDSKTPIGFVSCHTQRLLHHNSKVAEIQEMFVTKEYRNQGVGSKMLESIKSQLTKRKVYQLEVVSNRKRKLTHTFYLKQNFQWTSKKFVLKFK